MPNYNDTRFGVPAPGYSDRINHPDLLKAAKKQKKAGRIFGVILIFLPILGFFLYSQITGEMETMDALKYGGIISAVFLVVNLISAVSHAAKKSYEGVVIGKTARRINDDEHGSYDEFTTVVRRTDGSKTKIKERSTGTTFAWDYLQEGDRFLFHPELGFPYEKYNKASSPVLYCPVCARQNPVTGDRCEKCGAPLLK